jgi:flavin-binding protein dodecin
MQVSGAVRGVGTRVRTDIAAAPSATDRNVPKSSKEAGSRHPSDDVFRGPGTTYVVRDASSARRTRKLRAEPLSATVEAPARSRGVPVTDHVYRLTEVVGSSETSVAEAIRTAVRKAAQTVRNIEWFEAKEIRGQVVDGDVAYFQVTVKLGFRVD